MATRIIFYKAGSYSLQGTRLAINTNIYQFFLEYKKQGILAVIDLENSIEDYVFRFKNRKPMIKNDVITCIYIPDSYLTKEESMNYNVYKSEIKLFDWPINNVGHELDFFCMEGTLNTLIDKLNKLGEWNK